MGSRAIGSRANVNEKEKSMDKLRSRLQGFGGKWKGSGDSSGVESRVIEEEIDDDESVRGSSTSAPAITAGGDDKIWPDEVRLNMFCI
jgi:hypothetical protein